MKNLLFIVCFIVLLGINSLGFAQPISPDNINSPDNIHSRVISWTSKNAADYVAIQQGNNSIVVLITVNLGSAGIDVNNCGTTTHINPGNSATCTIQDTNNPITFSTDNETVTASGTYQVQASDPE